MIFIQQRCSPFLAQGDMDLWRPAGGVNGICAGGHYFNDLIESFI